MILSEAPSADGEWQLPSLRAAMLFTYRALWLVLFAAGLASTSYFSVRNELTSQAQYEASTSLGFALYLNVSAEGQLGDGLGEEGRRLGFGQADVLMAVDGGLK